MPDLRVNGKSPVAAWIPSLDSAGSGTTTANDIQGGLYPMTLANMTAADCWASDTERGGTRAWKFSGSNAGFSRVATTAFQFGATCTLTGWFKTSATGAARRPLITIGNASQTRKGVFIYLSSSQRVACDLSSASLTANSWNINFGSWIPVALRLTTSQIDLFLGGVRVWRVTGTTADIDQSLTGQKVNAIGTDLSGNNGNNSDLFDDFRLWSSFLNEDDIALLASRRAYETVATGGLFLPRPMNGGYSA